jgi:membrane-associated phospholipid phosphatase
MKQIILIFILFFFINSNHILICAESIDAQIMRTIHTERNTNLDGLMKGISNSSYIILPVIPISLFVDYKFCDCKDKLYNSINIGSSIIITFTTSLLLKEIIKRPRPYKVYDFVENIGNEQGYSMPSIHTSTAFSVATSLTLIEPKWYIIIPSYLWASVVAYSRIHLGVHTFSDIIVGAIIGTGISIGTNAVIKKVIK